MSLVHKRIPLQGAPNASNLPLTACGMQAQCDGLDERWKVKKHKILTGVIKLFGRTCGITLYRARGTRVLERHVKLVYYEHSLPGYKNEIDPKIYRYRIIF